MSEQKKKGKSDEQIIKDATGKAGLFVVLMMFILVFLILAIAVIATETDLTVIFKNIISELQRFLASIYPKFGT
jgi:hypothetical protein